MGAAGGAAAVVSAIAIALALAWSASDGNADDAADAGGAAGVGESTYPNSTDMTAECVIASTPSWVVDSSPGCVNSDCGAESTDDSAAITTVDSGGATTVDGAVTGCITIDCAASDATVDSVSDASTASVAIGNDSTVDVATSTAATGPPAAATVPVETTPTDSISVGSAEEVALAGCIYAVPAGSTIVASVMTEIPQFDSPDGSEVGIVEPEWHGRPSILPVIGQAPGWMHVRLPQRPNGSTAWVRSTDVRLATTPFRVEIDVATTRLKVFEEGEEILDAPAGLGTEDAPTTVGTFFVAFMQEPPNTTSGWGPFVVVTSSHSETISDFQSFGDAIAAIHGPLGADDEIGETGAYVSHGCIRLHLDDLAVLRQLPVGTPIDVIDSSIDPTSSSLPTASSEPSTASSTESIPESSVESSVVVSSSEPEP